MWSTSLFIAIAIVIVTANVITMVIFTTSRHLRKRRYVFLLNLAVADFSVGLISIPMYIYWVTKGNVSMTFKRVYKVQDPLFGLASLFGLAALSVERAYATYFPFKHRTLSRIKYAFGIAGGWLIASLLPLIIVILSLHLEVMATLIVLWISIPVVVVVTAYLLIWIKMTCTKATAHHAIHHTNKKLTISLAIISLITLVAWIPFMTTQVEYRVCLKSIIIKNISCNQIILSYEFAMAAKWLQYGNSVVNVFIYALRMREFKNELLRRLRCCQSNRVHQANERFELQNINHIVVNKHVKP